MNETIENIDADLIITSWLLDLDEWLIKHQSEKNESKLKDLVYKIKQWSKVLQSNSTPLYLQSCLQSYSNEYGVIIESFKKHVCAYTIVECRDVPLDGYDAIIMTLYYSKFVRKITEKIEAISIICSVNHSLVKSPEIQTFLTGVVKKANITISAQSSAYRAIQQHIEQNREQLNTLFCSIFDLCTKVIEMMSEISLDENTTELRMSFAALTLNIVNRNMDETLRELEILQDINKGIYTKIDRYLTNEFISNSYVESLNKNMENLLPELKKIPKENIIRVVAIALLELPYYTGEFKCGDHFHLKDSKLEFLFFVLYQPSDKRGLFHYISVANYHRFNDMDMTISREIKKPLSEFEPDGDYKTFLDNFI